MNAERLLEVYEQISEAPDAIARLRRFMLDLAVRGKLVIQDAADEPAHLLLQKIEAEKDHLVRAGEIRKRDAKSVSMLSPPFEIPASWCWTAVGTSFAYDAGVKTDPKNLDANRWLLELEDVEKGTGRLLQELKVGDREAKSTKSEFRSGDVLYGKLRPYLNKVVVADQTGYSTTEIVAIRPYIPLCSEYVALAFRRPDFVDYVERKGQGTKMPRLRTEDAVVAPFPLPPLAEQHRIVAKVDELMALCDRLEEARKTREETRDKLTTASLARLTAPDTTPADFPAHAAFALEALPAITTRPDQIKTLRQTILNLAVRGKLVDQDPTDKPVSVSLSAISAKRDDMVKTRELRREKPLNPIQDDDAPFQIPSTWRWVRVGELALFTQYGTSAKAAPSETGISVLTMGNIQNGAVVRTNEKRIPKTSDELPNLYLKNLDLLYNRTNSAELVGKTGLYRGEDDCLTFASYLIRIRLSADQTSPAFVNMAMNAPDFRETQIVPHIKKQTGQANVSGSALKNMLIPLPPHAEQHRIVAKVDALMALCDRLEAALTTADTTRTRLLEALLHEALEPASVTLEAAE